MNSVIGNNYQRNSVCVGRSLFFVCAFFAAQILYGCGIGPDIELFIKAVKDPKSVVGRYFEVEPGRALIATEKVKVYEAITSEIKKDAIAGMKTFMDEIKQGVFVNLNKEVNSEQTKAKLIFQIVDYKEYQSGPKTSKDLFFKIKPCNKQYMDTTWWIFATDFSRLARATNSPYAGSSSDSK